MDAELVPTVRLQDCPFRNVYFLHLLSRDYGADAGLRSCSIASVSATVASNALQTFAMVLFRDTSSTVWSLKSPNDMRSIEPHFVGSFNLNHSEAPQSLYTQHFPRHFAKASLLYRQPWFPGGARVDRLYPIRGQLFHLLRCSIRQEAGRSPHGRIRTKLKMESLSSSGIFRDGGYQGFVPSSEHL